MVHERNASDLVLLGWTTAGVSPVLVLTSGPVLIRLSAVRVAAQFELRLGLQYDFAATV